MKNVLTIVPTIYNLTCLTVLGVPAAK